jgi:hypothetical protein
MMDKGKYYKKMIDDRSGLAEKRKLGSEPEYKKERSRVRKFCNAIW